MAVRTDTAPAHPYRLFVAPAALAAAVAGLLAVIRRHTREPRLPRMSDAWMKAHAPADRTRDPWR